MGALFACHAHAATFCPDRPGQTTPPCVVDAGHVMIEAGNDGQQIRIGIGHGFEIGATESDGIVSGTAAYSMGDIALQASVARSGVALRVPMQHGMFSVTPEVDIGQSVSYGIAAGVSRQLSPVISAGLDASWFEGSRVVPEVSMAWQPAGNVQFDVGATGQRVIAGVAVQF